MTNQINDEYIFPIPYWWIDITDIDNDKMLEACYEIERNDPGRTRSNIGGYQTVDLSHDHPAFRDLLNHIQSIAETVYEKAYLPFWNSPYKISIGNYWCNINRKHAFNMNHVHPGSFLSGVYYVKADSELDQGSITFRRDHNWVMQHRNYFTDPKKKGECPAFLEECVSLPARTGALLLFPSSLPHHVEPNQTDADRVAISFNIDLK
jgi:uncharacterized protein (TIGR02466 family)